MCRSFFLVVEAENGVINKSVAIPLLFLVIDFRQLRRMVYQLSKESCLWDSLTILLGHPRDRSVGSNNQQRQLLIKCFCYSRAQLECSRTRSATYSNRKIKRLYNTQRKIAGTSLINHTVAGEITVTCK